ncbi:hydroxycinnamoyl-CoA:piscidic acid hydroxycinnamoyltransferase-like [Vicia villosa]|uniref:hydroxycinnamoyl-CoA:piscidic acid hydroxycinnamoyltransferase-like n=1 Tax=Vicia villosa TaxID=3911 RepID=UPI00273B9EE8|nr:hydroxycinnamoyl-CoA:piscidic acid hydroxycinnamoyltransferase-like [Vicia villosa]
MVTIKASYTVIPEESTPEGRLWLCDKDQVACHRHIPTIYIYKPKQNHENAIHTLKNTLSKILVHYYPIAGRLCYADEASRRIELNLNAKGTILLEAETTKEMNDYGDFSPSDSTKELVPIIDYTQPIEEIPLFLVQLTRFHNNEGFAIGVAFSHPLSDGLGAIGFINSWAKVARGETLESNELPFLDRTILRFSHKPLKVPRFQHMELHSLPLILGRTDTSQERKKKTTGKTLKLSLEQVEKLKKKANEFQKGSSSRAFSRYEAIGAHIWRCASKARELEENQESVVRFHADIRKRMVPPLPKNIFMNALALTATKGCIGEIISKPLGYVSEKLREASELLTDEYIRSQIDVIRSCENMDDARELFFGDETENAPYFGNPNFQLTSWMGMPFYEADFGWGKPIYFGFACVSPHDRAFILLNPDGDGSVIVCLHFQIAHLELFNKFFYGDI